MNTKPCGQVQVQYMMKIGILGRRPTLQSVGTMCDSGITEGSVTRRVAYVSPRDGAAPTSLHPTCRVLDWEGDTKVTQTGVMRKVVHARKICDKGLAVSRLEAPLVLWNIYK